MTMVLRRWVRPRSAQPAADAVPDRLERWATTLEAGGEAGRVAAMALREAAASYRLVTSGGESIDAETWDARRQLIEDIARDERDALYWDRGAAWALDATSANHSDHGS